MSFRTLKQKVGIAPNHRLLLAAGQITLVAAVILRRIDHQLPTLDFIEGMLTGFSIVANLAGIILSARNQ